MGLGCWAVTLFETSGGRASKTGQFNDSILLDSADRPYLGQPLGKMVANRPLDEPVFKLSMAEWVRVTQRAAALSGLDAARPVSERWRPTRKMRAQLGV